LSIYFYDQSDNYHLFSVKDGDTVDRHKKFYMKTQLQEQMSPKTTTNVDDMNVITPQSINNNHVSSSTLTKSDALELINDVECHPLMTGEKW
jgi:hypothetical protein